jgi:hypothetical protein
MSRQTLVAVVVAAALSSGLTATITQLTQAEQAGASNVTLSRVFNEENQTQAQIVELAKSVKQANKSLERLKLDLGVGRVSYSISNIYDLLVGVYGCVNKSAGCGA